MRAHIYSLAQVLWRDFLKRPIDDIPTDQEIARLLKKSILTSLWYKVYDLLRPSCSSSTTRLFIRR